MNSKFWRTRNVKYECIDIWFWIESNVLNFFSLCLIHVYLLLFKWLTTWHESFFSANLSFVLHGNFKNDNFENDYFEFKSRASCVKQTAVSESLEPIQTTQVFWLIQNGNQETISLVLSGSFSIENPDAFKMEFNENVSEPAWLLSF